MRYTFTYISALLLLCGAFYAKAMQPAAITYPVEVIGPNGTTETVTLDVERPEDAVAIQIRAHSIGYPDHVIEAEGYETPKASIRLGKGEWTHVKGP